MKKLLFISCQMAKKNSRKMAYALGPKLGDLNVRFALFQPPATKAFWSPLHSFYHIHVILRRFRPNSRGVCGQPTKKKKNRLTQAKNEKVNHK